MADNNKITEQTIAELLGCAKSELPKFCLTKIASCNFEFSPLTSKQRDDHILKILLRLDADPGIQRSTDQNIEAFEQGWRENYELCRTKGVTRAHLKPKYVRPYDFVRFQTDYIAPKNPYILDDLLWLAVNYSFHRYLNDFETVYEFGCGTGQYLYDLAQMFPQKTLVGTDWTKASGDILKLMADAGMKVSGTRFDMLRTDNNLKIAKGSAIVTIGALEQLGSNFQVFLNYLLSQKPELVIHHEPIEDFYGTATLFDYIGLAYHRRRNYLHGYLPALRELEKAKKIEIVEAQRVPFGDPFHESASRIVWRPI